MNKTEREAEIIEQLTAFEDEKYEKSEYLDELLKLQGQMADITFKGTNSKAKVRDIYNYLSKLNDESENVADAKLEKFKHSCGKFNNEIMREISGIKGENLIFSYLQKLRSKNVILRNVEIEYNGIHTEIDFLVFTRKAIFIIEVKNSTLDIFINEDGEMFRYGDRNNFDSNIKEKIKLREELITKILNNAGIIKTNFASFVVFTNNRIQIENHCRSLNVVFLGQFPYRIDRYNGWEMFSEEHIDEMVDAVNTVRLSKKYRSNLNIGIIKNDFADVVATLEEYNSRPHGFIATIKSMFKFKIIHKTAA